jgi:hypothetical protein
MQIRKLCTLHSTLILLRLFLLLHLLLLVLLLGLFLLFLLFLSASGRDFGWAFSFPGLRSLNSEAQFVYFGT